MSRQTKPVTIVNLVRNIRNVEINVRVVCLWARENHKNKGEIYGMEMILVDGENNIIQASISKSLIYKFKGKVIEGHTYRMGKFTTAQNIGYMTATHHECRIWFEFSTYAIETNADLPKYGFHFTSFADIIHDNVPPNTYIDVVGEFETSHPIAVSEKGNEWTHIDLTDNENNKLSFYVFGDYVGQVVKIVNDYADVNERPILALQCVSRTEWKGDVRITSTFNATRIHVNPDINEVKKFKQQIIASGSQSSNSRITQATIEDSTIRSPTIFKKLSEVLQVTKPGIYTTVATISELDANFKWYYYSCKFCRAKATLGDDMLWRCTKDYCKGSKESMSDAVPRFQVRYHITDDELENIIYPIIPDEEISTKIMLFEAQLEPHINKTAAECLSDLKKAGLGDTIPEELELLIGKQFVCKLEVSRRFNIEQNSNCYTALSITNELETIEWWKAKYNAAKEDNSAQGENDLSSTSNYITPQKRALENVIDCDKYENKGKATMADQGSTARFPLKVKVEKE